MVPIKTAFGNTPGGVSIIRNARLVVSTLPYWVDLDTAASLMGPVDIPPGETVGFTAGLKVNERLPQNGAAADITLAVLTDSPRFVPSSITWRFTTDNGFLTMRGECVDNSGINCGRFLSPDKFPPVTELAFEPEPVKGPEGEIYLPVGATARLESHDDYVSNAEISRCQGTRYSVDKPAWAFYELEVAGDSVTLSSGRHLLYFAGVDNAGNPEPVRVATVTVESAPDFEARRAASTSWLRSAGFRARKFAGRCLDYLRGLTRGPAEQEPAPQAAATPGAEARSPASAPAAALGEMALVPGGEFTMGYDEKIGLWDDHGSHKVYVDSFRISKHEVTLGQFRRYVQAAGLNLPRQEKWSTDLHPVVNVQWAEADAYCRWAGGRLPSEAEWERAARGGATSKYCFGDSESELKKYAWFNNWPDGARVVGAKEPNKYGLYDMHGNAMEWVSDWYAADYYQRSPYKNPAGADGGTQKVVRGGSWAGFPYMCRADHRDWRYVQTSGEDLGFRCALSVQ